MGSDERKELAREAVVEHKASIRQACNIFELPRSMFYYQRRKDDSCVIEAIQAHIDKHVSHGLPMLCKFLWQEHPWNHKRIGRVYRLLKLNLRRRGKKRLPSRIKEPLLQPLEPNICWSMDFMSDTVYSGLI